MRQIGSIEGEQDAARFGDYLLTQGVRNRVEETSDGSAWAVWIEDDDQLDRGRAELEQFQANPRDARYDVESHAETIRQREDKAQHRRCSHFIDVRTRLGRPAQLARPITIV